MCIVAIAWQVIDEIPLCLISNRDEFYQRPTKKLHYWHNSPIIAGQDLTSYGTWMGVTVQGRWAVLTNFRDGTDSQHYKTSRGSLVSDFLQSAQTPIRYAQSIEKKQTDFAGFNLIVGDQHQAVYMSNRGEAPQLLARGVYVLSNGLMSQHWEKTARLRKRFTQEFLSLLQLKTIHDSELEHVVWDILQDQRQIEASELLPQTGVSEAWERILSSTFIQTQDYGTRCSNYLLMKQNAWQWIEKQQYGESKNQSIQIHQKIATDVIR